MSPKKEEKKWSRCQMRWAVHNFFELYLFGIFSSLSLSLSAHSSGFDPKNVYFLLVSWQEVWVAIPQQSSWWDFFCWGNPLCTTKYYIFFGWLSYSQIAGILWLLCIYLSSCVMACQKCLKKYKMIIKEENVNISYTILFKI